MAGLIFDGIVGKFGTSMTGLTLAGVTLATSVGAIGLHLLVVGICWYYSGCFCWGWRLPSFGGHVLIVHQVLSTSGLLGGYVHFGTPL